MDITLLQGILIAIVAIIAGIDAYMEGFFIFRPIIVSTVVGLILGELEIGIICGGLTELSFAGLTPVGGTQPPNPVIAGIMAPVLCVTAGIAPIIAVPLTIPFALLMQYIILFYYSTFSFFMPFADKAAKEGNIKTINTIHMITMGIVGLSYAIVVFLSSYAAQNQVVMLVENMPQKLLHGFEVAGGILPAVGFALLLRIILKKEFVPYLIVGIVFTTFIVTPNMLPLALIGVAFAMYEFFNEIKLQDRFNKLSVKESNVEEEDYSDGI